jgi:hypothetical protein
VRSGGERRDAGMVGAGRRRNKISGQFSPKLIEMLESPAWNVLTRAGRKVIDRVEVELASHGGKDNGKLPVTYKDFVEFKIDRHAVKPAICEVVALGFVEVTRQGRAGNAEWRQPSLYRLTFRHADGIPGDGSHEWRRIKTIEEAREIKKLAREPANRREAKKALAKKNASGGKNPVSVGVSPTEKFATAVGETPITGSVGKPPLLSISRVGSRTAAPQSGSRSAPVGSAVASEPLSASEVAAAREGLIAMAMGNGMSRAEALAALDMVDDRDRAAPSSSSAAANERPRAAPLPPPPSSSTNDRLAAPAGRWLLFLQIWGALPEEASNVLARLRAARGPRDDIGKIIAGYENLCLSGREKLKLLTNGIVRMEEECARRDAIIAALREGPLRKAQVVGKNPGKRMGEAAAKGATGAYPSNVDTTASVNLSGSDSPSRASSKILTATSSTKGVEPVSSNRAQACRNARFIASRCSSSSTSNPPARLARCATDSVGHLLQV